MMRSAEVVASHAPGGADLPDDRADGHEPDECTASA